MPAPDPYAFLPAQDGSTISATRLPTATVIAPKSALTILDTAGTIRTIVPPLQGYHELTFLCTVDFINFDSGGNISAPTSPVLIGAGFMGKFAYNPINKLYYPLNIFAP